MSRLAKKPIELGDKVTATVTGNTIAVNGPLGALSRPISEDVVVTIADKVINVAAKSEEVSGPILGTTVAHIRNMVRGVETAYQEKLMIEGIGYKAEVKGSSIVFSLGFSHQINMAIPEGLKVTVEKNAVNISGINKDLVGHFTASVRALKKPEPYKGKGIMYAGEIIRRKQGKKAV